ncbi:hypothetical protein K438DRAFT_1118186 [Mycena galopus ATCC 62051]|nr:hypothetical protein K438DRAFT_1118186 [Mycena galopus ATCC 62051]
MTGVTANHFGGAKELRASSSSPATQPRRRPTPRLNSRVQGVSESRPELATPTRGRRYWGENGASASIIYSLSRLWTATFFVASSVSAAAITSRRRDRGRSCPSASAGAAITRLPLPVRLRSAGLFLATCGLAHPRIFRGNGVDFSGRRAGLRVGHPRSTSWVMVCFAPGTHLGLPSLSSLPIPSGFSTPYFPFPSLHPIYLPCPLPFLSYP